MEAIKKTESLDRLKQRTVYHLAQLAADERFPEMTELVRTKLNRIKDIMNTLETEDETRIQMLASRDRTDLLLDMTVRAFDLALLAFVNRNKKDPRYLLFFGTITMSDLIKLPKYEEIVQVRRLIQALDDPQFSSLREPHLAALQLAADRAATAISNLEQAIQTHELTRSRLLVLREEVISMFRSNYGALQQSIPNNKNEVESFFIRINAEKKEQEETTEGTV